MNMDLHVSVISRARHTLAVVASLVFGLVAATAQNAVTTVAGSAGVLGFTNGSGTAATFRFTNPAGAAVDAAGNLYVADPANHAIRAITPGGVVATFAGTGSAGSVNASGTSASFSSPQGVAVDGLGNVFVADTGNHTIRMITPGGAVSTLAGTAGANGFVNGTGAAARFSQPLGITVDRPAGTGAAAINVYVADTQNNAIRQIVVATGVVTTLAGSGASGFADGVNAAAVFNHPDSLVANATGDTLYVADTFNHRIRKIVITAGPTATVTTLAGSGVAGYGEGTGTTASFNNPAGICLDPAGNIIVADTLNHVIRSITAAGVTSLAAGSPGVSGNAGGLSTSARFNVPSGVAANASGIHVVDTNNQIVRRIAAATAPAISVQPANVTITSGNNAIFAVTATGNPALAYQWQRSSDSGVTWETLVNGGAFSGTQTSQLTITAATGAMSGQRFRVVIANGVAPDATSAAALLTVTELPAIASANNTTFTLNQAGSFQIVATGSPVLTYSYTGAFPTWASLNSSTGVISGTPTDSVGSPFGFTLTVSNSAGSASQGFTLTVQAGPVIATHPANQTVAAGQNATFSVVATGTPAVAGHQWQRSTDSGGTWSDIVEGGSYSGTTSSTLLVAGTSATMNGHQFRVRVLNAVGTTTSNVATLSVTQLPVFASANTTTFVVGQFGSFTVQATGSPAPSYSYTGAFPSWAGLNSATGVISGTPTDVTGSPFNFTLTATNSGGSVSQSFTLVVSTTPLAPVISTQPQNQSVGLGQTVTFTVVASGSPTPNYQWQRYRTGDAGFVALTDGGGYSGTNTATLTIADVNTAMGGDLYQVSIFNLHGTTVSTSAQLSISLGTVFSTIAGQPGIMGSSDGIGSAALFRAPNAIVVDAAGNAYVSDAANHVIRKITTAGVVTTLAGSAGLSGTSDGVGSAARFNTPSGVAVDTAGNVYVADSGNHMIRMITPAGSVSTIAGTPLSLGSTDGVGSAARFSYPSGIAIDAFGTLYVADTLNQTIRKITGGMLVTTFAGAAGSPGTADGTGSAARFGFPNSLAVDTAFNVYVADSQNHTIRKINAAGSVVTLAGSPGAPGAVNGLGAAARFNRPNGIAVDAAGNVYVADGGSHTLRRITAFGDVTTLAGLAGTPGSADGSGSTVRFNQPYGVALDSAGNIYVADTFNHTIRRSGGLTAPQIVTAPQNQVVAEGGTVTFTAVASGGPAPGYQWQRRAAGADTFVNLTDGGNYIGSATATLTVAAATAAMNGDEFRVVASNLVNPPATSSGATLTVAPAPVITSAGSATFRAQQSGSFTITATSTRPVTFSATGLPSWLTLNPSTGVLSGTPPDTSGSPFNLTITANIGTGTSTAASQSFILTVESAQVPPAITTHPGSLAINRGENATFTVVATGTGPLSYQWRRDGASISGATAATYTVANAQPLHAGLYSVTVTNPHGSTNSFAASLLVNAPPILLSQPRTQTALAGSAVTFAIQVAGPTGSTFQWRLNGVAIPGANGATYNIGSVSAADAGTYDVVVTNSLGSTVSSMAQLTIATAPVAPVFTLQPAHRVVVAGGSTALSAAASGAPSPTLQWRRNGGNIAGATGTTLVLTNVQGADAGVYDVAAGNSVGTTVSGSGTVRIIARSYAGIYFGSLAGGFGSFALYVREDNTGVFLAYLSTLSAPIMNLAVAIDDAGQFSFSQAASAALSAGSAGEPARAAALNPVLVSGTVSSSGGVSGSVSGGVATSFSGSRSLDTGVSQAVAGFYQAGATNSGAVAYAIVGGAGQAMIVAQVGPATDGGLGTVNSGGQVAVATGRSALTGAITPASGAILVTANGAVNGTLTGASETVLSAQRLLNISSRARVGAGETVAIAGFVIAGVESKPVLIRAVGPTLGQQPFSVPGVLSNPKLDLHRLVPGGAAVLVATNTGIAGNRTALDAAAAQIGAFALGSGGADSAILTTLAPGNYTATVSSATTNTGVALVEVYDLSAATAGQKLLNISTRAIAGSAENTLIAGVVVSGSAPKRVLIRAIGPGLTPFGVTGVLAQPALTLHQQNGQVIAANTNWSTSADAAAIGPASSSVGAFPLANQDSALIVTLAPGNYTAQVAGAGTATGVALIEVYELP